MRRLDIPPALVLFFLSPLVGELLSGSAPPAEYFSFPGFVILHFLYGGGAVLAREVRVRWRRGVGSLILLGCAYGVIEEGVMVASFFNPGWVDLGTLGVFGRWFGVNWVWAVGLTIYHSLVSITAPALLVELVYPDRRGKPWLGDRWLALVALLFTTDVIIGSLLFGRLLSYAPSVTHLVGALIVTALLVLAAQRLPANYLRRGEQPMVSPRRLFAITLLGALLCGLSFYALPNIPPTPPIAVMLATILVTLLTIRYLSRFKWREAHPIHVFAVTAGALAIFIPFSIFSEFDMNRVDNTNGMSIVGLLFTLGLLMLYRRVQARETDLQAQTDVRPMRQMRRSDKEIDNKAEIRSILHEAKHVTVAMSLKDEPYLATLSHGYDEEKNCIYFHCAVEGKKLEILHANPVVWGQALVDGGYQQGSCDHLYRTAQFHGRVSFVSDQVEKEHALRVMIRHLDDDPEMIIMNQITPHSMGRILVGRIDIDQMTGKKADKVIVQL